MEANSVDTRARTGGLCHGADKSLLMFEDEGLNRLARRPPEWHEHSLEGVQAVTVLATSAKPRSWISNSRIRNFCILPVTVIGKESTNRISSGILK